MKRVNDEAKSAFLDWVLELVEDKYLTYHHDKTGEYFKYSPHTHSQKELCYTVVVGRYPDGNNKAVILLEPGENIERWTVAEKEHVITARHDGRVSQIYDTLFEGRQKPKTFWETAQASIKLY